MTPKPAGTHYNKIGDHLTFVWNYTRLASTPTAIDILASVKHPEWKNFDGLYTISTNVTFDQTQTLIWDTGTYQTTAPKPLVMGDYQLIIHDAAVEMTATPHPGKLCDADLQVERKSSRFASNFSSLVEVF